MYKTTFICIFLTAALSSWSQIGFEERVLVDYAPIPNGPNAVEPADIDGDGDLDLLVTSSDFRVSWWENIDGQGNFGARHYVNETLIFGLVGGKAGDIDGDGDLDVVVGATLDVWWFENLDGKGHFSPKRKITGRDGTKDLDLGDLDADGDPDLVITTSIFNSDEVVVYRNNEGNFGQIQVVATRASGIRKVRMEDIDLDGDLDVMTAAEISNQGIRWYPNTGNGSFGGVINVAPLGIKPVGFFAGDLDGDADVDVLSASGRDSTFMWIENSGNNTDFADPIPISQTPSDPEVVWAEDVDEDGDLDVFLGANGENPLRLYRNAGNANFSGPIVLPGTLGEVVVINSADLDGDGDPDLIAASKDLDQVVWFKNLDGMGNFGELRRVHPAHPNGLRTMLLADLDDDGDDDILIGSETDGQIAWLEHLGQGVFRPFRTLSFGLKGIQQLRAADLDGDGDLDLVANAELERQVLWLEHLDGKGTFGTLRLVAQTSDPPRDVYLSDIDGDGDQDVLTALEDENDIIWYANLDGMGTFSAPQIIDANNRGARRVIAADIDGDGDNDVVGGGGSIYTYWYENTDGAGTFADGILLNISNVYSLEPIDLDIDGDLDLVISTNRGTGSGSIGWIENLDGLGTFGEYRSPGSLRQALHATAVDINQDGQLDLLGAGASNHEVVWYERVSDSLAFGLAQIISDSARGAQVVLASDIDMDGDVDVFSASIQDNKVAWYLNLQPNANQIRGTVRFDFDQNGCSAEDDPARGLILETTGGLTELGVGTNDNGFYQLFPAEGAFSTRIASTLPPYFSSVPADYASTFAGLGQIDTADFCLVASQQVDDVAISLFSSTPPRPGFPATFQLVYRNIGSTTVSGNLSVLYDENRLEYTSASVTPLDPAVNPLQWRYSDLRPFESRSITLRFQVFPPPITNLNDTLIFSSTVSPQLDNYPVDNHFVLRRLVMGAYDPNDISVLEGQVLDPTAAEDYLHYVIRFQNTGNAEAINVRVTNQLDERLDWSTFQLEASSHSLEIQTTEQRLYHLLFENIFLADSSSNFEASNGYIAYRIKPGPGFSVGDTIYNQADIYFDFNPPIITNEVHTTLRTLVGTRQLADTTGIKFFPNPTRGILNIRSPETVLRIEVYDLFGQRVLTSGSTHQLELSEWPPGAYFIWCYFEKGWRSGGKVIKW